MHHTLINDDLLLKRTVGSIMIEFKCLNKLVFVVSIVLKSFNDRHASLVGLDDLHGQVFHEVVMIFCDQVTFDDDGSSLVFIVLGVVILLGQLEECVSWVLYNASPVLVDVILHCLNWSAASSIFWSICTHACQCCQV